tara:strand:- start:345 stop:593 length:249 start_codon:yes stop_codon:yes gene_type:complete
MTSFPGLTVFCDATTINRCESSLIKLISVKKNNRNRLGELLSFACMADSSAKLPLVKQVVRRYGGANHIRVAGSVLSRLYHL